MHTMFAYNVHDAYMFRCIHVQILTCSDAYHVQMQTIYKMSPKRSALRVFPAAVATAKAIRGYEWRITIMCFW